MADRDRVPDGLHHDRILAYQQQSGLTEGCVFIAYRLADKRVTLAGVRLARSDDRNAYSSYMPTPFALLESAALIDGQRCELFALGAAGGCGGDTDDVIGASVLLREPGNFVAVSENGEGLSIISPARHLALFLYFG